MTFYEILLNSMASCVSSKTTFIGLKLASKNGTCYSVEITSR